MFIPVPNLLERYVRSLRHPTPPRGGRYRPRPPKPRRKHRVGLIAALGGAIGIALGLAMTPDQQASLLNTAQALSPTTLMAERQARRDARVPPSGFKSCADAKAAGFGLIRRGERAYSWPLDRDGDGRACEWNAGLLD